jgi:hypothetical protein
MAAQGFNDAMIGGDGRRTSILRKRDGREASTDVATSDAAR